MAWQFWKTSRKLSSKQIAEGNSTKFLFDAEDIPHEPKAALAKAKKLLHEAGYTLIEKPGLTRFGREFSTTLRKRIWLEEGWDKLSDEVQAEILWHELVHVGQRQAWGHAKFIWRYKSAEGRWCIEAPAYRQSLRAMKVIGHTLTKDGVEQYAERLVDKFREGYLLGSLDAGQYRRETLAVWRKEAA